MLRNDLSPPGGRSCSVVVQVVVVIMIVVVVVVVMMLVVVLVVQVDDNGGNIVDGVVGCNCTDDDNGGSIFNIYTNIYILNNSFITLFNIITYHIHIYNKTYATTIT